MNAKFFLLTVSLLLLLLHACRKEYSFEGGELSQTDTLPANYPFATGYCNGKRLGVAIADTNNYIADTSQVLPAAAVLLDMPTPGNQGGQGSCTAWAVVYGAGDYYKHIQTGIPYSDTGNLSPKFTYNQITTGDCTCTSILDNLYLLKTQGACTLHTMPYNPDECALQPDSLQRAEATDYKISGWQKVDLQNLLLIKHAILDKKPVVFAINIDDGFKNITSPFIWKESAGKIIGGHALVIAGYDDDKNAFRVMNSWSSAWGDNGFIWIDYDFFMQHVLESGYVVI